MDDYQAQIREMKEDVKELEKERLGEIEQFNRSISDIKEKIVGTGIGKLGEVVTIKDLKSAFPMDSFSDQKATRGGADIVATVREAGTESGRIVVSVKYAKDWSEEFLNQLSMDMRQERTSWGMLVTKSRKKMVMEVDLTPT